MFVKICRNLINKRSSVTLGLAVVSGFGFFQFNSPKKASADSDQKVSNENELSFTAISPVSTNSSKVYLDSLDNMDSKVVNIVLRERNPKNYHTTMQSYFDHEKNVMLKILHIQRESCDKSGI